MIGFTTPIFAFQTGIPNSWICLKVMSSKRSYHSPVQIIMTSAEVTLNGGLGRESHQNPLNPGL